MPLPTGRPYSGFVLTPIVDPSIGARTWGEPASIPLVRELIRRHAELPSYGSGRFSGTRSQKNALWRDYRNYVRQALSYFDAAVNVPDRSACLLYYYSLLNFAKAELLCTRATQIVGQRIAHGLSFNPIKARKVTSDALVVHDGVFRLLYEQRVGRTIASGQRLGIQRLLANIPEITSQLTDVNMGSTALTNLFH